MEAPKVYRGRLIDHLHIVAKDFEASKKFYKAVMNVFGIPETMSSETFFSFDELFVSSRTSEAALGELTGRLHLAFQAKDQKMVQEFHRVALANGGKDNGAPGLRPYHPTYYGAFVLDPDGNNIEAVFHGENQRSSDVIEVTF